MSRRFAWFAATALLTFGLVSGCGGSTAPTTSVPQQPNAVPGATGAPQQPNAVPGATGAPAPAPAVTTAPDAQQPAAAPAVGRSASAGPSVFKLGDSVIVSGAGWPVDSLITASLCGNNFLNGSVDCSLSSAGQTTSSPSGTFSLQVIPNAFPPKPCPCVVHVAALADSNTVDTPVDVTGAPVGTPSRTSSSRAVDVNATITGGGPLSAYFGGQAKRELVLVVTNTGSEILVNPVLNLTFGKGQDPATPLPTIDGLPVALGTLQGGQTATYRLPVTIGAVAFGQYRVQGEFIGLDSVSVDQGQNLPGDLSFQVTTSTYPWILIVLAWLALQIPLLGLYKRRPVVAEDLDEDPLLEELPVAGAAPGFAGGIFEPAAVPVGVGTAASLAAPAYDPPVSNAPPPPPGFQSVGPVQPVMPQPIVPAAAVAAVQQVPIQAALPPQPVVEPVSQGVQPLPPMPPATVLTPVANPTAEPVFGVNELRSMMQPPATLPSTPPLVGQVAEVLPPAEVDPVPPSQGVDVLRALLQSPPGKQ